MGKKQRFKAGRAPIAGVHRQGSRRTARLVLAISCSVVGLLGLSGAAAQAALVRPLLDSFGAFSGVQGVAVDQSSGDVYVFDAGSGSVAKFDAAGNPVDFSATGTNTIEGVGGAGNGENEIAVDSSSGADKGDIYVANNSTVRIYSAQGSFLGALSGGEACGVAVDPAGDVYVGFYGSTVRKYAPTGNPVTNADEVASIGGLLGICNVAVDGGGSIYAATYSGGINKYEAMQFGSLEASGTLIDEHGSTLAVDQATNDVFVDEGSDIAQYDSAGTLLGASGVGDLTDSNGVAVKGGGDLYASNGSGQVDIFGAAVVEPDVTTQAAGAATKTKVTLNGSVNPDGTSVSACKFEYGVEYGVYDHAVACAQTLPLTGNSPVAVSAEVIGLIAGGTYYYRLAATNANGTNDGEALTFVTPTAVDGVTSAPAEDITSDSATLNGSLAPDGEDAHYYFEYGTESTYGSTSPTPPGTDAGSASETVAAKATLTGLASNTTYHYRLVAVNAIGTSYGEDETLTTLGPPTIVSESTEGVTHTGATLNAQIDPNGYETSYRFEYGPSSAYGTSVPIPDGKLAAGSVAQSVSAAVTGLELGATYHYRVVASNEAGLSDGLDQTFTAVPAVAIDSVTVSKAVTSATLNAEINPLGTDTDAYFQYGTSSCIPSPSSCSDVPASPGTDLGSGETDKSLKAVLQGLQPNTTYYYRAIATNALGDLQSTERTFKTFPLGSSPQGGCANEQLRTEQDDTQLPDCRAYEMVSPGLEKHGAEVGEGFNPTLPSLDGNRVVYNSAGAFDGATQAGGLYSDFYMAQRGARGWGSTFLSPFPAPDPNNEDAYDPYMIGASADLSTEFYSVEFADAGVWLGYPDGKLENIAAPPGNNAAAEVKGSSLDGSHIVMTSGYPLAPIPGNPELEINAPLLYDYTGGQMRLVNADDTGHLLDPHGAWLASSVGPVLASRGAISDDGSRIFFLSRQPGDPSETNQLYVRLNNRQTVEISASQHSAPAPAQAEAMFTGASSDGTEVLFVSSAQLTDAATGSGPFLYEYDLPLGAESGTLKLIGGVQHPLSTTVQGTNLNHEPLYESIPNAIVSEDGTHVYYDSPDEGGSIYAYDTESGQTTLVVAHAPGVRLNLNVRSSEDISDYPADVSQDGNYLTFGSTADLVAEDTNTAEQIYVYDYATRALSLASNGPGAPAGDFESRYFEGVGYRSDTAVNYHLVNDNGEVFFQTPAPLEAQDTNGTWDIYEWHEGHVSLISSGRVGRASVLVGASAEASNVFFFTYDRLVPQDGDDQLDVYDARVNGGFAVTTAAPLCSGEGCQGSAGTSFTAPTPASSQASSSGNLAPSGAASRPKPKAKPPSRAQKLAKALKTCRRKRSFKQRALCQAKAKKRYGPTRQAKKSTNAEKSRRGN